MTFPLGWGNSVAIRNAFLSVYNELPIEFSWRELEKFDYPAHEGDKEVIDITRGVIKRQTGLDFKHILLTNGATGAVTISLRGYKEQNRDICIARKPPYYVRYPNMIRAAGLSYRIEEEYVASYADKVYLLDYPSNPLSLTTNPFSDVKKAPIILDGVYYNNVYTSGNLPPVNSEILIGSYSKLLGLNGLRVGWIATNNDAMYDILKDLVTSEYSGLGTASSEILKSILEDFDWEDFEKYARICLNHNREEWTKLERYFDGTKVSDIGMFYYSRMDEACKKLFIKAGIEWTHGSTMGTDDNFGRFNIGQDQDVIKNAVKAVIKMDTIVR